MVISLNSSFAILFILEAEPENLHPCSVQVVCCYFGQPHTVNVIVIYKSIKSLMYFSGWFLCTRTFTRWPKSNKSLFSVVGIIWSLTWTFYFTLKTWDRSVVRPLRIKKWEYFNESNKNPSSSCCGLIQGRQLKQTHSPSLTPLSQEDGGENGEKRRKINLKSETHGLR